MAEVPKRLCIWNPIFKNKHGYGFVMVCAIYPESTVSRNVSGLKLGDALGLDLLVTHTLVPHTKQHSCPTNHSNILNFAWKSLV